MVWSGHVAVRELNCSKRDTTTLLTALLLCKTTTRLRSQSHGSLGEKSRPPQQKSLPLGRRKYTTFSEELKEFKLKNHYTGTVGGERKNEGQVGPDTGLHSISKSTKSNSVEFLHKFTRYPSDSQPDAKTPFPSRHSGKSHFALWSGLVTWQSAS